MLNADLIIGTAGLIIAGVAFFASRGLSFLGGVFVNYVLVAMAFLAVLMLIKGFIKPEKLHFFESSRERHNILTGIIILAIYLFLMPRIGFLPASYIFYLVLSVYLSERRFTTRNILVTAIFSGVVVSFFYFLFKFILEVPLPKGSWFIS